MELNMMSLKSTGSAKTNNETERITGASDQGRRKMPLPVCMIWLCVLVWILMVWPGNLIREEASVKSVADDDFRTEPVTQDMPVIQEFRPTYDRLYSIGFVFNRDDGAVTEGNLAFKVYDANIELLAQRDFSMEEIEDGKITEAVVDLPVRPGELYYFRLEVSGLTDVAPTLSYRSLSGCGPEENGQLYYGSTVIEDGSAVSRYEYRKKLDLLQILTYDSLGVLAGMIVTVFWERHGKKKVTEK